MRISIRRAVPSDSERATELARSAKAHWGYPAEWLAMWDADLKITASDIERHATFIAALDDEVVGICQLQESDEHAFLEHVWVDPRAHRRGVGRALVEHARNVARGVLAIVADPHAEPFYPPPRRKTRRRGVGADAGRAGAEAAPPGTGLCAGSVISVALW